MWFKKRYSYPNNWEVWQFFMGVVYSVGIPFVFGEGYSSIVKVFNNPNVLITWPVGRDLVFDILMFIFSIIVFPYVYFHQSDIGIINEGIYVRHISNFYGWTFIPWGDIRYYKYSPVNTRRKNILGVGLHLYVYGTKLNNIWSKLVLRAVHNVIYIGKNIDDYEELYLLIENKVIKKEYS